MQAMVLIRREALSQDPAAFAASESSDGALDPETLKLLLAPSSPQAVFGAFDGDRLVGMAGVYRPGRGKEHHKAVLWGMYVTPESRRGGLGRALLAEVIRFARSLPGVQQLQLSVSDSARRARKMYEEAGFTTWGVEPASLCVGGEYITVRHMALVFVLSP
jgi:ribosomal protein S18 acetylase RimI-like enzyme